MTDQPASTAPAAAHPRVKGCCPACGWLTLYLGSGGHITCSRSDCPNPCAADDQLHRGQATAFTRPPGEAVLHELRNHLQGQTRHRKRAEATLRRVTSLYEQWVKAGPPPLGVPTSRWWDARLVELHNAIRPPADQTQE